MKIKNVGFGELHYGTTDLDNLLPKYVPAEFLKNPEPWKSIAEKWFKRGLEKTSVLTPIQGIDKEKAIKHIECLFNTFYLNKKRKITNASFLLSQWFTQITI